MRIGIDAHYLGNQSGGNETYTRNLLRGLQRIAPPADFVLFCHPDLPQNDPDTAGFDRVNLPVESSYLRVPFVMPWLAARHRLDLLHVQYTAPPWCPCPYVVTLHDIVMLRFPESLAWKERYRLRWMTPRTLGAAARVFTVTHAMRAAIHDAYAVPLERIDVTGNALSPGCARATPEQVSAVRAKYQLPERYVLYLGLLQPRKNVHRLAEAVGRLHAHGLDHKLVIVGKKAWLYDDMLRAIAPLEAAGRVLFTGYADQEDLPALYTGADVFAFVSLYEGFGIPVIESLACGTPVLASTDPALIEVAGGGALHVDPLDVDAIEAGLVKLLTDDNARAKLLAKGGPHARTYTPEAVGQAAWAGYQKSLAQRR
ncbi:MAG: glycosyltransferase [Candidatus Hydrogenedens sp.]|nr:glycosyltransferase [Candidatus Hydrogenedens sp.]